MKKGEKSIKWKARILKWKQSLTMFIVVISLLMESYFLTGINNFGFL